MFSGSMVALVTPFKNGGVDWQSLEGLIAFHLQNGTNGIVPCGTTGESATLSHEEHDAVIRAVIKAVNKRVPVIAGTGSNSTEEAVRLTREAEKSGADGALMISPYYNRPTQEGIYQHYKKVASGVGIPIIVYNIPGRTGSKIEPETLARLAEIKNIAGVKEATGSVDQAIDVIRLCGDRLAVYSGEDTLIFSLMALGGKGVISTVANVAPKETAQLAEACLKGDWEKGRELQFKLIPLIHSLFIETNPIPVKTALSLMGKCSGDLRLPLTPMAEGNLEEAHTGDDRVRPSLKISWRSGLSSAVSAAGWAAPLSGRFNSHRILISSPRSTNRAAQDWAKTPAKCARRDILVFQSLIILKPLGKPTPSSSISPIPKRL